MFPASAFPKSLFPWALFPGEGSGPVNSPGQSLAYHVYGNGGNGGPVDYAIPLATVTGTTWDGPPLANGSRWTFAVRAFAGSFEEQNVDARVDIVIDAAGVDITAVPPPPVSLSARPAASGGVRVDWSCPPSISGPFPTGFRVWATPGDAVDYAAAPAATATWRRGLYRYSAAVGGLIAGTTYAIGVRAYNAVGSETNTRSVPVIPLAGDLAAVEGLTATASF